MSKSKYPLLFLVLVLKIALIPLSLIYADDHESSFVTAYPMEYSQYDTSSDPEIWISIIGSVTSFQVTDNNYPDYDASLAVTSNRNIIVAWEATYDAQPTDIRYAVLDSSGNVLKPDIHRLAGILLLIGIDMILVSRLHLMEPYLSSGRLGASIML